MKYSICKDEKVKNTVKRIKKILKNNGIEIEEEYTTKDEMKRRLCPSVRINIANTNIGTNGKGTGIENSFASGYGEFMERLQNLCLINFEFPDIELVDKTTINKNIICNTKIDVKQEKIDTVPFYSVKDGKVINIPLYLFDSTTGFVSGNTYEEALVQGLSEICERYALKNVLLNKLSLPIIPEELYIKYDKLKNIIDYYNLKGYEIIIKDASIGQNIPVVCAAAINKKENTLVFKFASHPTLSVSIERALTEIFQGRDVQQSEEEKKDVRIYIKNDYYKKYYANNLLALFEKLTIQSIKFENNNDLMNRFILNPPDFELNKNSWIRPSIRKISNKELLKFLMEKIGPLTEHKIYVRDVSFLGFPSVSIYIPNMSKIIPLNASQYYAINKWKYYQGQSDSFYDDIRNLQNIGEFLYMHPILNETITNNLPIEYIIMLCSIVLDDYPKVVKYSDILIDNNVFKHENLIKIIKDYYCSKQIGLSDKEINKELNKLYTTGDIEFFYRFIKNLSFNIIKRILLNDKIETNDEAAIIRIKEKLKKTYQENIPNQMNLAKFFS